MAQRGSCLQEENKTAQFEAIALPLFGAAYNLARWLVRDDRDAEDVVQDAYLRAFRFLTAIAEVIPGRGC